MESPLTVIVTKVWAAVALVLIIGAVSTYMHIAEKKRIKREREQQKAEARALKEEMRRKRRN